MGRYIRDIRLEQPIDVVSMVMDDFVYHNRYFRTDWNGEMVFSLKDRHGKERYMKWHYVDGEFHVEAWLKNAFGGETDLKGGGAAKKEFRGDVDRLIQTLQKTAAGSLTGGHIGSDPIHHDSGHTDNHNRWKEDTRWQQNVSGQQGRPMQPGSVQQNVSGQQGRPMQPGPVQQNVSGQQGRPVQPGPVQPGPVQQNPYGQQNRPSQPDSSESRTAMIYACLALALGWLTPLMGIILIIMAWRKAEGYSNERKVKTLCILAVVVMVLGFVIYMGAGIFAGLLFDY